MYLRCCENKKIVFILVINGRSENILEDEEVRGFGRTISIRLLLYFQVAIHYFYEFIHFTS